MCVKEELVLFLIEFDWPQVVKHNKIKPIITSRRVAKLRKHCAFDYVTNKVFFIFNFWQYIFDDFAIFIDPIFSVQQ